jgi:flagellar basal body-associated protein FliL
MKKVFTSLLLAGMLMFSATSLIRAQEEPKPKKDTVNQDTYAKPTFYYSTEDEKAARASKKGGSATVIAIVCGVVVVAAGVTFFLLKKKK